MRFGHAWRQPLSENRRRGGASDGAGSRRRVRLCEFRRISPQCFGASRTALSLQRQGGSSSSLFPSSNPSFAQRPRGEDVRQRGDHMRYRLSTLVLAAVVVLAGALSPLHSPRRLRQVRGASPIARRCHEKAVGAAFAKTKHAGLDQSCANCHKNVAEHVKAQMAGEANGPVPSMKKLKADEINTTCLTCHEKANQANYDSSMHARRNVACTSCHSVHASKSVKALLKTKTDVRDVLHVPQVGARQGDAHLAPPRARRQDGLRRAATTRTTAAAEDDQGRVGQRALLQVPHREARPVPLRARAGPRGLRGVPRASRLEPQAAADPEAAEPVLELPPHGLGPLRIGRQPLDRAGRARGADWRAHRLPDSELALRRAAARTATPISTAPTRPRALIS